MQRCKPTRGIDVGNGSLSCLPGRDHVHVKPLDSILPGPFTRSSFIPLAVCLVDMSDLGDEGVIGVGVSQQ